MSPSSAGALIALNAEGEQAGMFDWLNPPHAHPQCLATIIYSFCQGWR
jgi:hypothetical protein